VECGGGVRTASFAAAKCGEDSASAQLVSGVLQPPQQGSQTCLCEKLMRAVCEDWSPCLVVDSILAPAAKSALLLANVDLM
jgi:hypothetical protein